MSGGYYNSKRGVNLNWVVQQTHMDVIVRCPQTFGHIVHLTRLENTMILDYDYDI